MRALRLGIPTVIFATSACVPSADLPFPERNDAKALVVVIIEDERPTVIGLAPGEQLPLSLPEDARLYLLAFDRTFDELVLLRGFMPLAGAEEMGRALPRPIAWSRGTLDGFDAWSTERLPSEVNAVRLASLDLVECWEDGGCLRPQPLRCQAECAHSEVQDPMPPDRDPTLPDAPDRAELPSWMPSALFDCGPGEAHFYGAPSCERVGAACPTASRFASDVPPGAIHVDLDRAGDGDGSRASPRNRLPSAVPPGSILALAEGRYDFGAYPMLAEVAIYGACVAGTELVDLTLGDRAELRNVRLPEGASIAGSGVILEGVETFRTITIRGDAMARELAVRSATIGVDATGALSVDRFFAEGVSATALRVVGSLAMTGAVIDGLYGSLKAHGAITVSGPAEIDGVYLRNVERIGLYVSSFGEGPHSVRNVVVQDLRSPPADPGDPDDFPRAGIRFLGEGSLANALVRDAAEIGLVVASSSVTIDDLTIRDVRAGAYQNSTGIYADAAATFNRVVIGETYGPGLGVVSQSEVVVRDLIVEEERRTGLAVVANEQSRIRVERAVAGGLEGNGIWIESAHAELEDVVVHDLGSVVGILVTCNGSPSSLVARQLALQDVLGVGISLNAGTSTIEARIDELTLTDVGFGLNAEGAVDLGLSHVLMERGGYPMGLRGGTATVAHARFDGILGGVLVNADVLEMPSLPTELYMNRVKMRIDDGSAVEVDGAPASARLQDLDVEGGWRLLRCGKYENLQEIGFDLRRVRIDQTGGRTDGIGLDMQRCRVTATDLQVRGVRGVGAIFANSTSMISRFFFGGNELAIRADDDLILQDGRFVGNRTALQVGRTPSPDQMIGVSFEGNVAAVAVE